MLLHIMQSCARSVSVEEYVKSADEGKSQLCLLIKLYHYMSLLQLIWLTSAVKSPLTATTPKGAAAEEECVWQAKSGLQLARQVSLQHCLH